MYSPKGVPSCPWVHLIAGGLIPGGVEIRDVQRAAWPGLSAGWEKWDPVIMDQLGPVGMAMIERLGIAGDQRHLDIAAGTGEPGLTVARLAPGGHGGLVLARYRPGLLREHVPRACRAWRPGAVSGSGAEYRGQRPDVHAQPPALDRGRDPVHPPGQPAQHRQQGR